MGGNIQQKTDNVAMPVLEERLLSIPVTVVNTAYTYQILSGSVSSDGNTMAEFDHEVHAITQPHVVMKERSILTLLCGLPQKRVRRHDDYAESPLTTINHIIN